jgi:hypothetical protein
MINLDDLSYSFRWCNLQHPPHCLKTINLDNSSNFTTLMRNIQHLPQWQLPRIQESRGNKHRSSCQSSRPQINIARYLWKPWNKSTHLNSTLTKPT